MHPQPQSVMSSSRRGRRVLELLSETNANKIKKCEDDSLKNNNNNNCATAIRFSKKKSKSTGLEAVANSDRVKATAVETATR